MKNRKISLVWSNMFIRCTNPICKSYKDYGAKGITICPEWHSYKAFETWALTSGYADGLTIERKDYNKGYEPDNCMWVDRKTQARNRTTNIDIMWKDKTQTLIEWAEELGFPYTTLYFRIQRGWTIDRAFTTPKGKYAKSK